MEEIKFHCLVFIEFMDSPDPSIKKTSSGLAEYFFLKLELISLILFLDATTPPIFNKLGSVGWVPTITLTSHIRGFPVSGPLKVSAKTEFVTKGFMEEDREIWDADGNLVGQSKQMAKLRIKK